MFTGFIFDLSNKYRMSGERKTIQINPELFKVSNKTPKKKEKSLPRLNIKPKEKVHKQKTVRKNVLKMIRERQQEEYKRLFDKKPREPSVANESSKKEFDKSFDETLEFFSSLAKKTEIQAPPSHNVTLKQYPPIDDKREPLKIQIPEANGPQANGPQANGSQTNGCIPVEIHTPKQTSPIILQTPKYGCLKNGTLPTYRSYQSTLKKREPSTAVPVINTKETPVFTPRPTIETKPVVKTYMKKTELFNNKAQRRIKYLKRKKIYKRTYRVGKHPKKSKISVLITNKTVRNRLSTQAQLLKQTPMNEIRKFLIKKGFIKVGSSTPNDVLRKMYESVSLVCGEIQNHNNENLLYNFLHDKS